MTPALLAWEDEVVVDLKFSGDEIGATGGTGVTISSSDFTSKLVSGFPNQNFNTFFTLSADYFPPSGQILALGLHTSAFDFMRLHALVNGHWTEQQVFNDQFASVPGFRFGFRTFYDPGLQQLVMAGGAGLIDEALHQMWGWDGRRWAPVLYGDETGDGSPFPRDVPGIAYDQQRRRAVLFGGQEVEGGNGLLNDTWEFDGQDWLEIQVQGQPPSPRKTASLAFDSVTGKIWMFGGIDDDNNALDELWSYDGSSWTEHSAADSGDGEPAPDRSPDLAFNESTGTLFASDTSDQSILWEWTGTEWNRHTASDPEGDGNPSVGGSIGRGLLWEPSLGAIVLVLAGTIGEPSAWRWMGASWKRLNVGDLNEDGIPSARNDHALAYDPVRDRAVFFGGDDAQGTFFGDTWEWNGDEWILVIPTDIEADGNPEPRAGSAMAYDETRQQMILFGGATGSGTYVNDTWEWDGSRWLELSPVTQPKVRQNHAMAWSPTDDAIVMVGGNGSGSYDNQRFWAWSGTNWDRITPTDPEGDLDPPEIWKPGLVLDPVTNLLTLHHGYGLGFPFGITFPDGWQWDGVSWEQIYPGTFSDPLPPRRGAGAYLAVPNRAHTFLLGGTEVLGLSRNDAWVFDAGGWRQVVISDPQGNGRAETGHGRRSFLEPATDAMFFTHGLAGGGASNETWRIERADGTRPAVIAGIDVGHSELLGRADPVALTLRSVAGGDGFASGTPQLGAEIHLWAGYAWRIHASHGASATTPANLEVVLSDPLKIQDTLTREWIYAAIQPRGNAADEAASVFVNAVEMEVLFSVPR
jgi:hypothetical protein